jgi:hypothetical protein
MVDTAEGGVARRRAPRPEFNFVLATLPDDRSGRLPKITRGGDMAEIDPDRFTLRQVDGLREDYAQVMEELDLVKELLVRLPTRRE